MLTKQQVKGHQGDGCIIQALCAEASRIQFSDAAGVNSGGDLDENQFISSPSLLRL